jgi:hypothetical protein
MRSSGQLFLPGLDHRHQLIPTSTPAFLKTHLLRLLTGRKWDALDSAPSFG